MTSAGWAVIGAIGGALVGSLAGVIGEAWLRGRGERHRAKVGARLLRVDLEFARAIIDEVLADDQHRWYDYFSFNSANWETYGDTLAARLEADDFKAVTTGVVVLRKTFSAIPAAPNFPNERWMALPPGSVEGLRGMRREASIAHAALAAVGGFERGE
jgi:hypothetical protein